MIEYSFAVARSEFSSQESDVADSIRESLTLDAHDCMSLGYFKNFLAEGCAPSVVYLLTTLLMIELDHRDVARTSTGDATDVFAS